MRIHPHLPKPENTEMRGILPTYEMPEAEAVAMAKRGNAAGHETLYRLHRGRVYSLCLRHTSNASDAEDLTHDVFMQVLRKIKTFRGDSKFGSWLYRVALNSLLLHARKQKRRDQFVVENLPEDSICGRSRWPAPADQLVLQQALGSLSVKKRNVVFLHDIKGLTHREVAWRLGLTVTASKSRLHRAHIALRDALIHHTSQSVHPSNQVQYVPSLPDHE
jgi:RNA polymerase sigma-70 factor (ECF subfamily)